VILLYKIFTDKKMYQCYAFVHFSTLSKEYSYLKQKTFLICQNKKGIYHTFCMVNPWPKENYTKFFPIHSEEKAFIFTVSA